MKEIQHSYSPLKEVKVSDGDITFTYETKTLNE